MVLWVIKKRKCSGLSSCALGKHYPLSRDPLGGKIMPPDINLDPGPCSGNALSSSKGSLFLERKQGFCSFLQSNKYVIHRNRLLRMMTARWWPQKALSVPQSFRTDTWGSSEKLKGLLLPTGCRLEYCILMLCDCKQPQSAQFKEKKKFKEISAVSEGGREARTVVQMCLQSLLCLCDTKRNWHKDRKLYLHCS